MNHIQTNVFDEALVSWRLTRTAEADEIQRLVTINS